MEKKSTRHNAKEVVMSFIDGLNKEDFKASRKYLSDDMVFRGVMGSRDGGDAYMKDMEKMKLKYDIKKTFADEDDVCIFTDLKISGAEILCCSWYQVKEGKIHSLNVIFDPRPVLEAANKKELADKKESAHKKEHAHSA